MSELTDAANEKLNPVSTEQPRRRGRPPGSKNKPRDSAPSNDVIEGERPPFVYIRDEQSVKASMAMGMTVWFLASKMLPIRELTEDEGMQLGEALDPVLCKWIPILGEWKYEANLMVCIVMLYLATKIEKPITEIPTEDVTGIATK